MVYKTIFGCIKPHAIIVLYAFPTVKDVVEECISTEI